MKRKEFIKQSLVAVAAGVPLVGLVSACGDDNSDPGTGGDLDCLANGTRVSIGANHGHDVIISKEDVEAGVERIYSIAGTSAHSHVITLTEDHFQSLQQNQSVTVTSDSSSGHTHSVTVRCA